MVAVTAPSLVEDGTDGTGVNDLTPRPGSLPSGRKQTQGGHQFDADAPGPKSSMIQQASGRLAGPIEG